MSQAITITVSDTLYEQLQSVASLSQKPAEVIILDSLRHTLPPFFEKIPAEYQADVFPLLMYDEQALLQAANQTFPETKWQRYEALLEKKRITPLTEAEQEALETLKHEADSLSLKRAYAAVLLKRKGYTLPFSGKASANS